MQTRHYDCEECFRVLIYTLAKNNIHYITQKAFDRCLEILSVYFAENFNINCYILGDTNFKNFTVFTRQKFFLSKDNKIAIFDNNSDLFNGIFHKKIREATKSPESLSVFGLSGNQDLDKLNFANDLTQKEKSEIKILFNNREKSFI